MPQMGVVAPLSLALPPLPRHKQPQTGTLPHTQLRGMRGSPAEAWHLLRSTRHPYTLSTFDCSKDAENFSATRALPCMRRKQCMLCMLFMLCMPFMLSVTCRIRYLQHPGTPQDAQASQLRPSSWLWPKQASTKAAATCQGTRTLMHNA